MCHLGGGWVLTTLLFSTASMKQVTESKKATAPEPLYRCGSHQCEKSMTLLYLQKNRGKDDWMEIIVLDKSIVSKSRKYTWPADVYLHKDVRNEPAQ